MKPLFWLPAVWLTLFTATSQAAEKALADLSISELLEVEITLDEVFDIFNALVSTKNVSVATGKRQEASRAPAVTTVVTAQDMEAMGARTLGEALESVPGLHVSENIVPMPQYILRGLSSTNNPEVLVLMNGVPFKALISGNRGPGWRDMPVQAIRRIEVIRGPGSALYGADAFIGVINIITKTAKDIEGTELGLRAGSFDTYDGWLLYGDQWGKVESALTLEYRTTAGPDGTVESDAQTTLDRMMGTQVSHAPGTVNFDEKNLDTRLDLAYRDWRLRMAYMQRDAGSGGGSSGALDPDGRFKRNRFSSDLIYHNPIFTPNWDVTTELNYSRDSLDSDLTVLPPGTLGGLYPEGVIIDADTGEEALHFGLSGFYAGFDGHWLRVGAGYRYEDVFEVKYRANQGVDALGRPLSPLEMTDLTDTPAAVYPEVLRENHYVFIQDTWQVARDWEFTAGVRYDEYSDFGTTVNPRGAVVWEVMPDLTAKLLYGRAFRAPSVQDLYIRNTGLLLGNPDLAPETIATWELAFDWRAARHLNLALNLYTFQIEDKIVSRLQPNSGLSLMSNSAEQDGHGLEFETRWKITPRASLLFNYAYAHTELDGADQGGYPARQAYLRTDWLLYPNWYLDSKLHWIGDHMRKADDSRPALSGYTGVDLTLRYKSRQRNAWNFAAGVRNLFDDDIKALMLENMPDLPLAGRHYFAEARYRF